MRFVCIQCRRRDIIIGDKAPMCLLCKVPLVRATESYSGIYMSLNFAIKRFESAVEKYGYERCLTGYVKQEREAWIAAVWALCLREETGREYSIEIVTKDQTPDCKVIYLKKSNGDHHRIVSNLEIVEWDDHRPNMMDLVRQKCAKAYPPYFTLIVLARNGKGLQLPDDVEGLDLLPSFRTKLSMISAKERGREYVEEQAHGSADDRGAEASGGGAEGGRRGAGSGRVEAHDLRLEGEVRRDGCERGAGSEAVAR